MKTRTSKVLPAGFHEDVRGAAYVEFLISFIPIFIMFLGMVQMALMFAGGMAVQRAASAAARAAMVVLDDDPQYYGGEDRMSVEGSGGGGSSEAAILDFLSSNGLGGGEGGGGGGPPDVSSARLSAIRTAASIPLMAVAPTPSALTTSRSDESVMAAIGNPESPFQMPASRAAFALVYNRAAMVVTFPDGPGSGNSEASWEGGEISDGVPTQVRVRVTYMFHCAVPLANRIMCTDALYIAFGANAAAARAAAERIARGGSAWDAAGTFLSERDRLGAREDRESVGLDDLREQDSTSWLGLGLGVSGALGGPDPRFKVMSAEAQLPIQFANYEYQSE